MLADHLATADEEVTHQAGVATSSLKVLVLSRQDGTTSRTLLRPTGEAVVVEAHLADADLEAMTMEAEDVVVAEEAAQEPVSDATRKVTWLVIVLIRIRDLLDDPWSAISASKRGIWHVIVQTVVEMTEVVVEVVVVVVALEHASSATRRVIWLVNVQMVTLVVSPTRGHAVMTMEATPGPKTKTETTTMATLVEVVAGELPTITTWTTLGARPTITMLAETGVVTVEMKVE